MNIWIKDNYGRLINLNKVRAIGIVNDEKFCVRIYFNVTDNANIGFYESKERAKEVIQLIQDHINAIGTNNFNNLPMVFEMPIE